MITLTRLHNEMVVVNAGLIEFIEATPDTTISMVTGRKIMVKESVAEVIALATTYFLEIGRVPYSAHELDTDDA